MLPRQRGTGARKAAPGLAGLLLSALSLSVLACGVPLGAAELTATAQNGGDGALAAAQAASSGLLASTPTPAASTSSTPAAGSTVTADATATPAAEGTPRPTATPPPQNADLAAELVKQINDFRAGRGLPALRVNPQLTAAAAAYARYMADANFFSHTGPDGSTPQSRLAAAAYAGRFKGEALAAGQASARDVLTVWANSGAHAAILLDAAAVEIGVGYYYSGLSYYGHYWVLNTGVP